jgi:protein required for attachment to host cells
MRPIGLIVADSAHCRFFCLMFAEDENFDRVVEFAELDDLVNPEVLSPGRDVYSNLKSGRNRASSQGAAHGYDDHRQRHHDEVLRRFAKQIALHTTRLLRDNDIGGLVVVANGRLLGLFRERFPKTLLDRVVAEIDEGATKRSVEQIRRLLEERGVLLAGPRARAV